MATNPLKIGFIGLGTVGAPMAGHTLDVEAVLANFEIGQTS